MCIDIRWKQRLESYKKACSQLDEFIEKGDLNKFEVQGLIKCFEVTFELAWKTVKDYLEFSDIIAKSPRETIQQAFKFGLIDDGHVWIDMLSKRNIMAHTYNDSYVVLAQALIKDEYYKELVVLKNTLEGL
jgi:nucleotidyltransferase substrate binding protein (TIGR01987 family)